MDPQAFVFSTPSLNQPQVVYFISRTNGLLVPLIPADELPYSVRLRGLPRNLTLDQTYGMQHVGVQPYTGGTFRLDNDVSIMRHASRQQTPMHIRNKSSSPSKQFLPPDGLARQAITSATGVRIEQHPLPQRPTSAHDLATTNWRKTVSSTAIDRTQAVIDAIVGATKGPAFVSNTSATPPSGKVPDQDKKEYCTHWIRTGECDYTQQGCLYKHEMPDVDTLKAIGFRGTPRWWIEKNQKVKLGSMKSLRATEMPSWWPPQISSSANRVSSDGSDRTASDAGSVDLEPKTLSTSSKEAEPAKSIPAPASVPNKIDSLSDSDDLIDLSTPLTPMTTPPTSPENDVTTGLTNILRSASVAASETPAAKPKRAESVMTPPRKQIFVPAGESPEVHIAQARKRASRGQTSSSCMRKTKETPRLDEQIQSLQKSKYSSLMASKYATPGKDASQSAETLPMGRKRVPKRDRAVAIRDPDAAAPEPESRALTTRGSELAVVVKLPGTQPQHKST